MIVAPRTVVRSLGLAAAASIVVSNMVGQGVFLKGRVMTCEVGSGPLMLGAWFVAGIVMFCAALALAELAAMMPESGGIYAFLRRAYGEPVAFAFGWMTLFVGAPAAIGALGTGAAIFLNRLSGGAVDALGRSVEVAGLRWTVSGTQWVALALIVVITAINCAPARVNGGVATAFAALKIATLCGISFVALAVTHGHAAALVGSSAPTCADVGATVRGGVGGFAAAMIAALYAYNGLQAVTSVAGEVRNPATALPRALIGAVGSVLLLYVLANASFLKVLGTAAIASLPASASVGVVAIEAIFGSIGGTLSAAILFASTAATLHIIILSDARVLYAFAADGVLFAPLARLSPQGVPVRAVLATSILSALLVLAAGFDALSDYYVFNTLVFFVIAVVALFVLRRREPVANRPYRVPGYPYVPALFIAVIAWVLAATTLASPRNSLIGLGIVAIAFPVYYARHKGTAGTA